MIDKINLFLDSNDGYLVNIWTSTQQLGNNGRYFIDYNKNINYINSIHLEIFPINTEHQFSNSKFILIFNQYYVKMWEFNHGDKNSEYTQFSNYDIMLEEQFFQYSLVNNMYDFEYSDYINIMNFYKTVTF